MGTVFWSLRVAATVNFEEFSSRRDGSSGLHPRTSGTTSTVSSYDIPLVPLCFVRFVELVPPGGLADSRGYS